MIGDNKSISTPPHISLKKKYRLNANFFLNKIIKYYIVFHSLLPIIIMDLVWIECKLIQNDYETFTLITHSSHLYNSYLLLLLLLFFLLFTASLGAVTNPIGSILSGLLAEYLGRKRAIQISSLPFLIGWLCIGLADNIPLLYTGRLITGIAAGNYKIFF